MPWLFHRPVERQNAGTGTKNIVWKVKTVMPLRVIPGLSPLFSPKNFCIPVLTGDTQRVACPVSLSAGGGSHDGQCHLAT